VMMAALDSHDRFPPSVSDTLPGLPSHQRRRDRWRCAKPSFDGSAAEPLERVLSVANLFRHIAPRNPGGVAVEHRFDASAIVVGGDATSPALPGSRSLICSHWSWGSAYRFMDQPCSKPTLHKSHKPL
jgi:hypothetical protein